MEKAERQKQQERLVRAEEERIKLERERLELDRQHQLFLQRQMQEQAEARRVQEQRLLQEQAERQRRVEEENRQRIAAEAKKKAEEVEASRNAISTGTGFFISPNGFLVTNRHVVEGSSYYAVRDQKGNFYRAEVLVQDGYRDLAILRVYGTFPALKIVRADTMSKGQRVMAVGYPQVAIQGSESKVTDGVISSFSGINNDPNWFQISTPIQGGNSGGPLVTEAGQVVGVVVATANAMKYFKNTGNMPQNVNYAIKSNLLLGFLTEHNIPNVGTPLGKTPIDGVDRATVLVIAKNSPIDVNFTVSPEQRAEQEREKARLAAEEAKRRQPAKPLTRAEAQAAAREEDDAWRNAETATDAAAVQVYLNRFPTGRYTAQANVKLEALKKAEAESAQRQTEERTRREREAANAMPNSERYTTVGNYPITDCVKDKTTGLTWEGKTSSGERAGSRAYTNFWDMKTTGDAREYAYIVNDTRLCGYSDWRLPTLDELQGLVTIGVKPTFDASWFPNTQETYWYWSSSPYSGDAGNAWLIVLNQGSVGNFYRGTRRQVRLVR
jgi:hypothetical protein